jgi:hypothetical protein
MRSLCVVFTILGAALLHAAPPILICPKVSDLPKVDGVLDEPLWQEAAPCAPFTRPGTKQPPAKQTTARVCFMRQSLLVAVTCEEPDPTRLRAVAQPGSENVWQDDCVEVWLKTTRSQLEFDQFIVNSKGVCQTLRRRQGQDDQQLGGKWQAAARVQGKRWTVEIAIPFATLGIAEPTPGTMVRLALGREDHTGKTAQLAAWPAGSEYGSKSAATKLYFVTDNLLRNPTMARDANGKMVDWNVKEADRPRFGAVREEDEDVLRFQAPGRYCSAGNSLRLKPNSFYRLGARVKGTAGAYLRGRTAAREGDPSRAFTVNAPASDAYQQVEVRVPTGETGQMLVIIGSTEGLGEGEVRIANLSLREDVTLREDGPAIPLAPGQPIRVRKLLVTDCRALRGFIGSPVDGSLASYGWNVRPWEYGMGGAGAGVGYHYRRNDGLHIALAEGGVDAVQLRGAPDVALYAGDTAHDSPGNKQPIWQFAGRAESCRAQLEQRQDATRFAFFGLKRGMIRDVSFLRVEKTTSGMVGPRLQMGKPADLAAVGPLGLARYDGEQRLAFALGTQDGQTTRELKANQTVHLLSSPLPADRSVGAIALRLELQRCAPGTPLAITVQDPLAPRLELMRVEFAVNGSGTVEPVLDFPDAIFRAGQRLWLTIEAGGPVSLTKAEVRLVAVDAETARREALAFRKLHVKGLFTALSEARRWNSFSTRTDLEAFYRKDEYGPAIKELAEAIAECVRLGPEDDTVRQYNEWFWRRRKPLSDFSPRIDRQEGAPEWAVLARQAWLAARRVPMWWLDNRLVPTGEFGGLVGDDSDMYQNYADFVMLESDGLTPRLRQAAADLAELAEQENLTAGLNRRTMDPLHAYEEGINQESLLLWWQYGDPVYFERCLAAAKSMPSLTTVTPRGHRHFKNQNCGAEDLRIDRELGTDGHAHGLMLHPSFEVAWYNRSPSVLQYLREWGDGWLDHQQPGEYATLVDVATEKNLKVYKDRPLYAGYGGQASAHVFLCWLTGEAKYIRPFLDFYRADQDHFQARRWLADLDALGALAGIPETTECLRADPFVAARLGDREPLLEALRQDIAEMQRFPHMYTTAEVFTDRVFLYAIGNAARMYTGGTATRNKYVHTHAVSWEGFGTDYAAFVQQATDESLRVLLYNFTDRELRGKARFWRLKHGRYQVQIGDGQAALHELARARTLSVALPSRQVVTLEVKLQERLDPLLARADLALSPLDLKLTATEVRIGVHNIGAAASPASQLTIHDAAGKTVATMPVPGLAAPTDLLPKRHVVVCRLPRPSGPGWTAAVDARSQIPEIYEENNRLPLVALGKQKEKR